MEVEWHPYFPEIGRQAMAWQRGDVGSVDRVVRHLEAQIQSRRMRADLRAVRGHVARLIADGAGRSTSMVTEADPVMVARSLRR